MGPVYAKLVALALAGAFVAAARYMPEAAWAFYHFAGIAIGKELLSRTGDVSLVASPEKKL